MVLDGVSTVAAALAALAFVPLLRPTDRPKEAACPSGFGPRKGVGGSEAPTPGSIAAPLPAADATRVRYRPARPHTGGSLDEGLRGRFLAPTRRT